MLKGGTVFLNAPLQYNVFVRVWILADAVVYKKAAVWEAPFAPP